MRDEDGYFWLLGRIDDEKANEPAPLFALDCRDDPDVGIAPQLAAMRDRDYKLFSDMAGRGDLGEPLAHRERLEREVAIRPGTSLALRGLGDRAAPHSRSVLPWQAAGEKNDDRNRQDVRRIDPRALPAVSGSADL